MVTKVQYLPADGVLTDLETRLRLHDSQIASGTLSINYITQAVQDSGALTLSSVSGTDTITGNLTPAITAYVTGQTFRFVAAGANTGAVTININGLGAKAVTKSGATALTTGDIPAGAVVNITYDGTQFQLSSGVGGSAGNTFTQSNLTVPAGTGLALVGPLTLSGTTTISGRLVIL